MDWGDVDKQEAEQQRPLPPYTRVTAIVDFEAEHPHDLPFSTGDQLTILEPCNVIFWYLAEDSQGRRGVIPINFVQVEVSGSARPQKKKPPPPPPPSSSSSSPLSPATPTAHSGAHHQQHQRKLSPQTLPRTSPKPNLHPPIQRTTSHEDQLSSLQAPPVPPKPRLPTPPLDGATPTAVASQAPPTPAGSQTPPSVPPRHPPPLPGREHHNVAGKSGSSSQGFQTWGNVDVSPAVPLQAPHKPHPQRAGPKSPLLPKPGAKTQLANSLKNKQPTTPSSRKGRERDSLPHNMHSTGAKLPLSREKRAAANSYENSGPAGPMLGSLVAKLEGPPHIDIDRRPPAPLPPEAFLESASNSTVPSLPSTHRKGKYSSNQEFMTHSGWFHPTVEAVLCRMASIQLSIFKMMTTGVFVFKHRRIKINQYIGKSKNICTCMIQMFHRLYERPENKLSPLELQLKYECPDADEWYVRFIVVRDTDKLDLEHAKMITQLRTLQPEGLNTTLEFLCREDWYEFAAWYKEHRAREREHAQRQPTAT